MTERKQVPVLDTGTGFRLHVKHPGSPTHVAQLMADVHTPIVYSVASLQLPYVHALKLLRLYQSRLSWCTVMFTARSSPLATIHQGHVPAAQYSIGSGNACMSGNCSSDANAVLMQKFVSNDRTESNNI